MNIHKLREKSFKQLASEDLRQKLTKYQLSTSKLALKVLKRICQLSLSSQLLQFHSESRLSNLLVVGGLLDQVEDLGGEGSIGQGVGLGVNDLISALKQSLF
jgi:hypothetical protein